MGVAFPAACRQWRLRRKLSQLELSLRASVSQRHISYLESGRSQPSREMVIRLADALDIPLRERNGLLEAAGFSAVYRETRLDSEAMKPVHDALDSMLTHHQPFPAVVIDRSWNIVMLNHAASAMFNWVIEAGDFASHFSPQSLTNLALLTTHPKGFRQFITNWDQVAPKLVQRLQSELIRCNEQQTLHMQHCLRLIDWQRPLHDSTDPGLLPVLPMELTVSGSPMSLFSVISTFGTPQDITTDDLKIEFFYPSDDSTRQVFEQISRAAV